MKLLHTAALLLAIGGGLPLPAGAQDAAVVTTQRVRAELVAHAPEGVQPGKPVWVGLRLTHHPEWHTYWKNPGDSGLPTQVQWTLPEGLAAGDIAWPVPKKFPIGNLANYGYEGTVLLPVPVTVAPDFKPGGDVEIRLQASWLVCKTECIPEDAKLALKIPATSSTAMHAAAFDKAFGAQPKPVLAGTAGIVPDSVARIEGDALAISVQGLPVALRGRTLEFFPESGEVIETGAKWTQAWNGGEWTARVPLSAHRSGSPAVMPVVLGTGSEGWRTELKVAGEWPKVAPLGSGLTPALEQALRANAATTAASSASLTLGAALLFAFLGGLILNLMPCVFPVLAIKVLGFTRHADDRRGHRISGIAYSAGVLLSFVALGALMVALRAAGEQLGWGFQLQSPAFVAALAALFTLIGLNLAGVFEFGSFLPSGVATLEARHPVVNAFLGGVLAVAVASPCTAPFMGASLGFAIGLPTAQALLVFGAIGLGMALPFLAASWVPAVARLLPKPGAWMAVFRKVMAFPMFATVAWLVWVIGQQSGIDGAGALLALLVAMSMVIWSLGLEGRSRVTVAAISLALFGGLAWAAGPYVTRVQASQQASVQGPWEAWRPGRVEQLLAGGQPVFVDFTAAWCVTCQFNKTTLARPEVLADLRARNVALLRADWTRRDPAISAALEQLGRNGVPVYVFYRNGNPPVVLSEVLGVEEIRSAIASL